MASLNQKKAKTFKTPGRRARKAPRCVTCGRTRRRKDKRRVSGMSKRRSAWSPDAMKCQFCKND